MALPDTVGPGQDAVHVQVLRLLVLAAQGSPPGAWGGGRRRTAAPTRQKRQQTTSKWEGQLLEGGGASPCPAGSRPPLPEPRPLHAAQAAHWLSPFVLGGGFGRLWEPEFFFPALLA